MAEYIDSAAIIAEIEANKLMAREPAAKRILGMLRDFPPADVAPVVHGRCGFCADGTFIGATCFGANDGRFHMFNYCPNCGAKMGADA